MGASVKTPEGKGTVVETALLTGKVKVKLDSSPEEAIPQTFTVKQLRPVRERTPNRPRNEEKQDTENPNNPGKGEKTEK